jgi:hypothetical protein
MAVETTPSFARVTIAAGVSQQAFDFHAEREQDVRVRFITTAAPDPAWLSFGVDYAVKLNVAAPGGLITFTPPLTGAGSLEIDRATQRTQGRRFSNIKRFDDVAVELGLDRAMLALQEVDEKLARALVLPRGDSMAPALPASAALRFLGTDASNKLAWLAGVASTPVSAGMAGAVAAAVRDSVFGFVNVQDPQFGAKGDVTFNAAGALVSGTDDTAAIQAAIDYLEATPQGRGVVFFPRGWYKITAKLRIKKAIVLQGVGRGQFHDATVAVNVNIPDAGSALIWSNPVGDKMVHIEPATPTGRRISGAGVVELGLYGNQQATHGVYARSVFAGRFDLYGEHVTASAFYLGVVPAADGIVDEARDSQYNRIDIGWRNTASNGGSIVTLDGDSGANASLNTINVWPGVYLNGDAINLINCDNNTFQFVRLFRFPGGTGRAMYSRGGATQEQRARANVFAYFNSQFGSSGAIEFGGLDDFAVPSTGNLIHLDSENSTPLPTIGKGATVIVADHDHDDIYAQDRFNLVVNGDFALNQLNAGSCTDKTAGFDGGVVLTQSAAVTLSSLANPEQGQAQCLRITQSNASAQRFGYLFVIPSEETIPLRGRGVALALRACLSASADVRVAIGEWTGTADAVAGDIVADWTSTAYTTAGFFTSTTQNVLAVQESAMTAGAWRDLSGQVTVGGGLTATVGPSANNLWVFVWSEGAAAQNVTLDIGRVRLIPGYMPSLKVFEDRAALVQRAERFVQKSYPLATAPGTNIGQGLHVVTSRAADQADRWFVPLRTRMLAQPSVTVYSQTGAAGNVRNLSAAADVAASVANVGEQGFTVFPTANTVAASIYGFNWVAAKYPWL